MPIPLRVLLIGDSDEDARSLGAELARAGYEVTSERVQTADGFVNALARAEWDLVISDHELAAFSAIGALDSLASTGLELPFIIVSDTADEDAAVAALNAGAHEFLDRTRLARLAPSIGRELREAAVRRERARLEEQVRQAQKMQAVGQLAGGVAHDFNNMLTAIMGYADLLQEKVDPDSSFGQDLHQITAAAERAAALTRQLLALSRKQVLSMTPVDLTAVAETLVPFLQRLIGERITVQATFARDVHWVLADAAQIEHAIVNLAVNARDAMAEGGVLTLSTGNVEIDDAYASAHPGAYVGSFAYLSVADTGVGMSPEVQQRVLEPFFTTKARGKGTGLGLTAVYGTVKQLGGYLEVWSQPGQGSRFRLLVPKTHEVPEPPLPKVRAAVPAGHQTFLVVEDDPTVRRLVVQTLTGQGHRVLEAVRAEVALQLAETLDGEVDVLVTDVVLPGLGGTGLAVELTQRRPGLRVLFMSGYAENWTEVTSVARRLGAGVLEKPFTAQALLSRIPAPINQARPARV